MTMKGMTTVSRIGSGVGAGGRAATQIIDLTPPGL
jgi:hypothetical protein